MLASARSQDKMLGRSDKEETHIRVRRVIFQNAPFAVLSADSGED